MEMNAVMKQLYFLMGLWLLTACNGPNINDKINHAGQKAGEAVSEIAKGVSKGVKQSFGVEITKADSNALKAIEIGKIILKDKDGTDNMLSVYIIFKKDFARKIMLRALDNKGLEMGRVSQLKPDLLILSLIKEPILTTTAG